MLWFRYPMTSPPVMRMEAGGASAASTPPRATATSASGASLVMVGNRIAVFLAQDLRWSKSQFKWCAALAIVHLRAATRRDYFEERGHLQYKLLSARLRNTAEYGCATPVWLMTSGHFW